MSRTLKITGPAILLIAALLSLVVALAVGGGAASPAIDDPGALVRFGLPTVKMIVNLSAAVALGALLLAVFALSSTSRAYSIALDLAAAAAGVWAVASAGSALFSFLSVTGVPLSFDARFGEQLGYFLTEIEAGTTWVFSTLAAAAVTVLCFAVRNQTVTLFVLVLAAAGLYPLAQQGHSATASDHDAAVTALWLHIVFAAVWLGGLLVIVVLRSIDRIEDLTTTIGRYSTAALVCFVVVAVSGYVSAEIRIGSLDRLASAYGALVLVKVAALVVLGVIGAVHRRYVLTRMADDPRRGRWFWQLALVELAFMGIASGTAAGLARTASPVPDEPLVSSSPTPAEILTGAPLPPPMDPLTLVTLWRPDLLWILLCGFGIFFYLAGARRLRRRGDRWPVHRTVLWVAGLLLLAYLTSGGINVYERYLFSAHMLAHMALGMMVPLLLVFGAPVTLAARAIRKRSDGSRGGREWILTAVHSRFGQIVANPIVAAVVFAASLLVFYYTPLFRWATLDHIGHEWMIAHFLLAGYLFVQSLVGVDPVPFRFPYPIRLLMLLATMAFHAFFGLALMTGDALLLADWYGAMGWSTPAIEDQHTGGGIAWSVGEIPTLILAISVAIQWSRSDDRETKRRDRAADRTGDADLTQYNAMLERLGRGR
ncbi:cytochrome c oxidase assembly protein [Herbiconiux sp. L3-i23]|uniref:cytochrome c oxidase assembly protein n=1 Tax=Herbiconiux sp. L3-i23 TaxID=2905871 RepID=UPI0020456664|nr:cytochrome c oxidase assembly protein [Herbiconiux sp. L3-i23]BDI24168.1 ABC transporter permease [Herbiconiux sp. L3-i23]